MSEIRARYLSLKVRSFTATSLSDEGWRQITKDLYADVDSIDITANLSRTLPLSRTVQGKLIFRGIVSRVVSFTRTVLAKLRITAVVARTLEFASTIRTAIAATPSGPTPAQKAKIKAFFLRRRMR